MRIGASLFLIAVGAILAFAVKDSINEVDLAMVGYILMAVGVVGLLITLVMMSTRHRTDVIHRRDGTTYIEPNSGADPRL
jgi:hypothetical protein